MNKISVQELRTKLINDFNIDEKEINKIKGKSNLLNYYESLRMSAPQEYNVMVDDFVLEDSKLENDKPDRLDKNWTKYILDQLEDDEKDENYPKTDGLRRLLEKEVCKITSIQTNIIQPPSPDNNMIATVRSTICLENGEMYESIADAQQIALIPPYDKFVSAIAETRAEGRVYRKALRLKNVVTKEEMPSEAFFSQEGKINTTQIILIDSICCNSKLNINVNKLLQNLFPDKTIENINSLSHDDGTKIGQALTEYQKDMNKIPEEMRGYSPGWR